MTTIRTANDVLATPGKASNIALWTLQVLVATGVRGRWVGKALGDCRHDRALSGSWHRPVVPIRHRLLEVLGAVLLLVPGKAAFGAVLLACVMAGAVVAHLTVLHTAATAPLVLFALTALIAWGRRSQLTGRGR